MRCLEIEHRRVYAMVFAEDCKDAFEAIEMALIEESEGE